MKILFDQNISFRILSQLNSFPDAQHVKNVGLTDEEDRSIWDYAIEHQYAIITFDSDFFKWLIYWELLLKLFGYVQEI